MKTFMLYAVLIIAVPSLESEAQETGPDWSVNVHASPLLFQGQIKINEGSWVHNYSFNTFIGIDLTRKLGEHFDASISFSYTKATASIAQAVLFQSVESSIPMNSFLTESYGSYLKLSFSPIDSGIFRPYVSAGFGVAYFKHEGKSYDYSQWATYPVPPDTIYSAQRLVVPFIPAEAGIIFNAYQVGDFRVGFDVSVLAMYSLRKEVNFDQAGAMTQPISAGIITGITVGW
ncbi:MAG TPA: hypothetical protein VLX91_16690 [Candidatus Acidoferrales bacterium]|nr:hypothetical protein [Candidatus Acidoferrales bacterium]